MISPNITPNQLKRAVYLKIKNTGNSIKIIIDIFISITLLIFVFPEIFSSFGTGLDASWQYSINASFANELIFGKDVQFTYGPLGFLCSPLDMGNNLAISWFFRFAVHIIFGIILVYLSVLNTSRYTLPVFATGYIVSMYTGLTYEYHLQVIFILLLCLAMDTHPLSIMWSSVAALFAGLLIFIKFSLFITSFGTIAVFFCLLFFMHHPKRVKLAAVTTIIFLSVIFSLALTLFHSFKNFYLWIFRSLEISDGYNVAMSTKGPLYEVLLGIFLMTAFVFLISFMKISKKQLLYPLCLFGFSVFIAFKHGFVRQDHILLFFSFMLAVAAMSILFSKNLSEFLPCSVFYIVVLLVSLYLAPAHQKWNNFDGMHGLTGKTGLNRLKQAFQLSNTRQLIAYESKINLKADVLPSVFVNRINASGFTVDCVPWEITYIPANNFKWSPNPVFQFYSVYTPHLDNLTAGHYSDGDRPDILLVNYHTIDNRHIFWDAPKSWRAILTNYEYYDTVPEKEMTVLRKKNPAHTEKITYITSSFLKSDQWIDIPASDGLVFAKIDMKLTVPGFLRKMLYKIPPVFIAAGYDTGKIAYYRMVPMTSNQGLLVNFLPQDAQNINLFFKGVYNKRVTKIKIFGQGLACYPKELTIDWYEMKYPSTLL